VQRLYVPESGRVLIDGTDIALVDVAWLRRQVGQRRIIEYLLSPLLRHRQESLRER
jgi:ABC-type bacteriocin/lantibiotic exporter with double-glycine peptidase domain